MMSKVQMSVVMLLLLMTGVDLYTEPAVSDEWIQSELDAASEQVAKANAALDRLRSIPPEKLGKCYWTTPEYREGYGELSLLDPEFTAEKVVFWCVVSSLSQFLSFFLSLSPSLSHPPSLPSFSLPSLPSLSFPLPLSLSHSFS